MTRYTQTELDKIMMIGFGKIDNAVEAVIGKYEAPQIESDYAEQKCDKSNLSVEAYFRYMRSLHDYARRSESCVYGLFGPQSMPLGIFGQSTALASQSGIGAPGSIQWLSRSQAQGLFGRG